MLHHLDLSYTIPEIRRILKPGGKILAVEALDYNPAIKLYRKLTPDMRTDWEKAHILNLNDVKFATRFLELIDIRYWHVLGYLGGKFPILLPFFDNVDRILEKVPLIQRLSWMFTFVLRKKIRRIIYVKKILLNNTLKKLACFLKHNQKRNWITTEKGALVPPIGALYRKTYHLSISLLQNYFPSWLVKWYMY